MQKANNLSKFTLTFLLLLGTWVLLTGTLERQEIIAGVFISGLVAAGTFSIFTEHGIFHLNPLRILAFIAYIPYYLVFVLLANIDMAYRILSPSLPIKPGIVAVKTTLTTDSGKLALANSITLTPGTITVDVVGDTLYVHWISVKDRTVEGATKAIVKPFEKMLKVIFT